jgi:ribosomal protein L37AE/L43A
MLSGANWGAHIVTANQLDRRDGLNREVSSDRCPQCGSQWVKRYRPRGGTAECLVCGTLVPPSKAAVTRQVSAIAGGDKGWSESF